jgi:hypothetical protein
MLSCLPFQLDRARVYGVGAEDGPCKFGTTSPDESSEAEDLPAAHVEGAVLQEVASTNALDAEDYLLDLHLRLRVEVSELAPNHHADQPVLVQLFR